jgi:hypothetical protein
MQAQRTDDDGPSDSLTGDCRLSQMQISIRYPGMFQHLYKCETPVQRDRNMFTRQLALTA